MSSKEKRLTVKEQAAGQFYEMSLRFTADACPDELNALVAGCGLGDRVVMKNAVTLHMTQTVPFVPDDETIARYAAVLSETKQDGMSVTNVRFAGYEYIYAVDPRRPTKEDM